MASVCASRSKRARRSAIARESVGQDLDRDVALEAACPGRGRPRPCRPFRWRRGSRRSRDVFRGGLARARTTIPPGERPRAPSEEDRHARMHQSRRPWLRPDGLDDAFALSSAAGWNERDRGGLANVAGAGATRLLRSVEPRRGLGTGHRDRLRRFGWIAMMLVDPAHGSWPGSSSARGRRGCGSHPMGSCGSMPLRSDVPYYSRPADSWTRRV